MNYSREKADAVDRIHNCIDAAASMMAEYYENDGEVDFPRTWQEYDFNKQKLFLQYSTENSDLEAQANALLGEASEDLVQEATEEDEDALDLADEKIEDDKASATPTMFGGKKTTKKKTDLH